MRNKFIILAFLAFASSSMVLAQNQKESCACCSESYKLFDFWLGEWDVYDVNHKLIGTNRITKLYDNCVLKEEWISTGTNRGTSYNFYDKTTKTWNQVWVDNTGNVLRLSGNYSNNAMVLKSELSTGKNGQFYNQISWKLNKNGTVTQLWELFDTENNKISEAFRGIYKKKLN